MQYSEWPRWLQAVVVLPHVFLTMFAIAVWWPKKTEADKRRFNVVGIYLLVFYLVLRFVFKALG
jgi:hypothetical protein